MFFFLLIITKSHNNYCSAGVMELCLLNLLILIDCFLCNSYPCVLFESLSHVINQESHVYLWNLGETDLVHFLRFWNIPRFTREISKSEKSELDKFIQNFPLKHVITSTNCSVTRLRNFGHKWKYCNKIQGIWFLTSFT